jgi:outer membrane protein assembly factor BamB
VADSTVYFAGLGHVLVALDTRTGAQRWQAVAGSGSQAPGENVLVIGTHVIMADNALFGFNRTTGAREWMYAPASGDMPGRFNISTDGTRLFTGSPAGFAYAINPETGQPIWVDEIARDNNSVVYSPVVDRGLVVVAVRHFTNPRTGGVVALDAATGLVRWKLDFPSTAPGRSSGTQWRAGFWRGLVIAPCDDGTIYALNRDTGAIVWVSARPAAELSFDDQRPITVVGDMVVVGSTLTFIAGLDAATGVERWRTPSPYGSVNYEMGNDGTYAYIVYTGLQLSAIDPVTGRVVWTSGSRFGGDYSPYPVISGDRIFVGGLRGYYALQR